MLHAFAFSYLDFWIFCLILSDMSSTVLRVKRRLEENPQDALVLMCKRIKTDSEKDVTPSLFVFKGTVENKEDKKVHSVLPRDDIKLKSASKVDDIIKKMRNERKRVTTDSRYEIVNLSRAVKDTYDLVDLETKKSTEESDVQYAYDLYVSAKEDFDVSMLDNLLSIEHYENELVFGSFRDNGLRTTSCSSKDESEDSNDENHWRNDYPDSDNSSIQEEDMIKAMARCDLDDTLSSDDDGANIYTNDPVYKDDVTRYGPAYAKYKAKVLSEDKSSVNGVGLVHTTLINDHSESYKDDSDDDFYYGQEENTDHFRDQYPDKESDLSDPD